MTTQVKKGNSREDWVEAFLWPIFIVWKYLLVGPYKIIFRKYKFARDDDWTVKVGLWTWFSVLATVVSFLLAHAYLQSLIDPVKWLVTGLGYAVGFYFSQHDVNYRLDDYEFIGLSQYYIFKQVALGIILGMFL